MPLVQTFPITSQNVSQLLSLDWPQLGLIVVLAVVIGVTLNSYLKGRRNLKTTDNETTIIKFLTDDNSPMVVTSRQNAESSKRVADAVEVANKHAATLNQALSTLALKTDEQTGEVKGLRKDTGIYQGLVTSDLSKQTETIATLSASVTALGVTFNAGIAEIKAMLQERIPNPVDCNDLEHRLDAFKVEMLNALDKHVKRATSTNNTVTVPEQTLTVEVPSESVVKQN